jgi:hypothetical protein
MVPTVSILMVTHAIEVMVWSLLYWTVEAAPPGANLTYFAFVNYTTLGYGDVLPAQDWRLLGPITAMNGVLLFGWSTAIIFEVLRRALARIGNCRPTDTKCAPRAREPQPPMSAFGTKRISQSRPAMSAFGGKADIAISGRHVCF